MTTVRTLGQQVRDHLFVGRVISQLSGGLAALATLLACIGLYGMLSFAVAQRTREIGLHMVLGASPGAVWAQVFRSVAWMTGIGALTGIAATVSFVRAARVEMFELQPHDPAVLAASAGALAVVALGAAMASPAVVALGAGLVPAIRASRIDPMQSLKCDQ